MGVKNSDLADFIALTLNDLPKQEFEVGWDNQDYEFCRIHQAERTVIDGGNQIERKVMLDSTGNAKYVRMFELSTPKVGTVMHTIKVPWVQLRTDYSWDKLEIIRQKNSAKGFIDLLKTRRIDGLLSWANLIEDRGWKTPSNKNDDLYPYGVPYYIRMLDKDTVVPGFNGKTIRFQDGSVDTVCAGIDAALEPKWRNYAAVYSAIDNSLLKTIRLAFLYTRFKPPVFIDDPSRKTNAAKRFYTDFDNVAELMDLADAKDDQHTGKEVLGNLRVDETGLVYLNRYPVVPIPQLNGVIDPQTEDAAKPLYFIDFDKLVPFVQDGYWMEESEPMWDRGQPSTFTVYLDGSHNIMCKNVRTTGFVIHKALTTA